MRKGLGKGKGKGYKNLIVKDPAVHSMSAKGVKQKKEKVPFWNRETKVPLATVEKVSIGVGAGLLTSALVPEVTPLAIASGLGALAGGFYQIRGEKAVKRQEARRKKRKARKQLKKKRLDSIKFFRNTESQILYGNSYNNLNLRQKNRVDNKILKEVY